MSLKKHMHMVLESFLSHKYTRCWTFEQRFEVRLSYPGQQLTPPSVKSNWGNRELRKPYTMNFEIQNMVVMKRRNKPKERCEAEWKQNDNVLIKKTLEDVKCSLPHWIMNSTHVFCL